VIAANDLIEHLARGKRETLTSGACAGAVQAHGAADEEGNDESWRLI
jgi:hypothetical protein